MSEVLRDKQYTRVGRTINHQGVGVLTCDNEIEAQFAEHNLNRGDCALDFVEKISKVMREQFVTQRKQTLSMDDVLLNVAYCITNLKQLSGLELP